MLERAIVTRGVLGWGNRKSGCEAYGPGGRWEGGEFGHLLGDHLEELGAAEGTRLIVVAVPSRFDHEYADLLASDIRAMVANRNAGAPDA